jgi:hypothetical protein
MFENYQKSILILGASTQSIIFTLHFHEHTRKSDPFNIFLLAIGNISAAVPALAGDTYACAYAVLSTEIAATAYPSADWATPDFLA